MKTNLITSPQQTTVFAVTVGQGTWGAEGGYGFANYSDNHYGSITPNNLNGNQILMMIGTIGAGRKGFVVIFDQDMPSKVYEIVVTNTITNNSLALSRGGDGDIFLESINVENGDTVAIFDDVYNNVGQTLTFTIQIHSYD